MKKTEPENRQSTNLIFTMLLFLTFVMCALFTVLIGGKVYENINVRTQQSYKDQVVLNYVANKIRQGDREDRIHVIEKEGQSVLEISQDFYEVEYVTWIYCRDGNLCELFTDPECSLGLADGLEITPCEALEFQEEEHRIRVLMPRTGRELTLTLRSS